MEVGKALSRGRARLQGQSHGHRFSIADDRQLYFLTTLRIEKNVREEIIESLDLNFIDGCDHVSTHLDIDAINGDGSAAALKTCGCRRSTLNDLTNENPALRGVELHSCRQAGRKILP